MVQRELTEGEQRFSIYACILARRWDKGFIDEKTYEKLYEKLIEWKLI